VGQSFAYVTGKPFISFISCLSALYEGRLKLDLIMPLLWRSPRCLGVFTRDPYTAKDLQSQGFSKVRYGGIPSVDWLQPTGKDLQLKPEIPMVALLPGSRLPEAARNFGLQLRFVVQAVNLMGAGVQFRAALVPALMKELPAIAEAMGWTLENNWLHYNLGDGQAATIACYDDAFNDIVSHTTLAIGMAGLAVAQCVALGKPAIQIPGPGPQFTYAFAEAENRMLGPSVQTIGTGPATEETLMEAALCLKDTLDNQKYLTDCVEQGRTRLGLPGGSTRIAEFIVQQLADLT
jgi:uncharacterized protein (TIGR03492 family)